MKRVRTILSVILSVTLFLQFSLPCFADVKNEIQAASSRSFVDDCGFFDDVHWDDDKNVRALTIVFGGLGL